MKKIHIAMRNSIGPEKVLELQFLDDIYDSMDWDSWQMTNMVADVINQIKSAQPTVIKCTINSFGGDVFIGLPIYDALKTCGASVEVEIIGVAASIASIISQAASPGKLGMAKNAFMIIHEAYTYAEGNAKDLQDAANMTEKVNQQLVGIYADRTGTESTEIRMLMPAGTDYWMNGQDAVDQKFADYILPENKDFKIAACVKGLQAAGFKNIPSSAMNKPAEDDKSSFQTFVKNQLMDFKKMLDGFKNTLKGTKIDASAVNLAEEIVNAMSEPMATMVEGLQQEVQNEIDGLKKTITDEITASFNDTYEKRIADLEASNTTLKQENEDLKTEIADKVGGETKTQKDPANAIKPLGQGVKAKVA